MYTIPLIVNHFTYIYNSHWDINTCWRQKINYFKEQIMEWEISVLRFLQGLRGETLNNFFQIITATGEGVLMPGIILIIYWCKNKAAGLRLGFTVLFSIVANGFLKNIIKAPRPFESQVVVPIRAHTATGYSFPSGHTQGATTFWLALMIHVKKKWLYYLGTIMITLVALSRLYLGVHWPVDVLAAIFLGIALTIIGQYIFEKIRTLSIAGLLLGCFLLGATLLLGFDSGYTKILGAIVGFLIGVALEERYVSFVVEGPFRYQAMKIIIGLGGLVVLAGGLKMLLPSLMIFDFARYMLIVIWVIAGAPYLFKGIRY